MSDNEIIDYLNHKSTLKNPSPNRFKQEAKEFLLKYGKDNNIDTDDLRILFYMWVHKLKELPVCQYPNCNKKARFVGYSKGFSNGCCHEHAIKASNLEKYGVEKPFQSKEIQNKVKETFDEKYGGWITNTEHYKQTIKKKYGVEHPMKNDNIKQKLKKSLYEKYGGIGASSEIIKDKMKKTNLKKYGVEAVFQSVEIQNKIHENIEKKYGSKCPLNNEKIKGKAKQTLLKKYKVDNPSKAVAVKDKIKLTNIKKYGYIHPMKNTEIKNKVKETMKRKFGVDNAMKVEKIKNKVVNEIYATTFEKKKEKFKEYGIEFLFDLNDYKGVYHQYEFKCLKCNEVFVSDLKNGKIPRCPKCYPKLHQGISQMETELFNSINYHNKFQSNRNIIGRMELDIIIPDKKIAIEFNGLYWHSELGGGKDKNYHLNKLKMANDKGYQLIHVFEDEWLLKKDIVLSIIHSKLGIFEKRIYARECEIKEISFDEAYQFFEDNHIQGGDKSKIRIGLVCADELVSVMSFSKPRFNKNYEWELVRYSSKLNTQIVGGISKLFNYFVKNYKPESVVSYADRRYSNGNMYKILGFDLDGITEPSFYIIEDYFTRYNRVMFQKHKLKDILPIFDNELTAWENLQINGYDRIWDCGHYRFVWKKLS